jgi:preprotein translocase subunit SecY
MLVLPVFFALVFSGLIAYFAFSPKSNRAVRAGAFIALILIVISVGISLALILGLFSFVPGEGTVPALPVSGETRSQGEMLIFAVFIVFVLALLVIIAVAFIRERRRRLALSGRE